MIPEQAATHILMSLFDESTNKAYTDQVVVLSWRHFAVVFSECEKYQINLSFFHIRLYVWIVFYSLATSTHASFLHCFFFLFLFFLLLPANDVGNPDVKRSLHCLNSFNFTINKCLPRLQGEKKLNICLHTCSRNHGALQSLEQDVVIIATQVFRKTVEALKRDNP